MNPGPSKASPDRLLASAALVVALLALFLVGAALWRTGDDEATAPSTVPATQPSGSGTTLPIGGSTTKPPAPTTFPLTTEQVAMPNLVNTNAYTAFTKIKSEKLNLSVTSAVNKDVNPGTVLLQKPAAGTMVRRGSVVTLVVSKKS
ncbi:hypothetical protein BH10ACT1_BH10ACT1_43130 [soil metagenome]